MRRVASLLNRNHFAPPPPAARRPSASSVPRPSACLARHGESLSCAWEQTHGRSDHVLVADGLHLGALRGCTVVAAWEASMAMRGPRTTRWSLPLDFSSSSPANDRLPSDSSGVDWFDDDSPGGQRFSAASSVAICTRLGADSTSDTTLTAGS